VLDARCVGKDIVELRGVSVVGVPNEVENELVIRDGAIRTWNSVALMMLVFFSSYSIET